MCKLYDYETYIQLKKKNNICIYWIHDIYSFGEHGMKIEAVS